VIDTDEKSKALLEALEVANKARKLYKADVTGKSLLTAVSFVTGILLSIFGAIYVVDQKDGNFTVDVAEVNPYVSISLSKTSDFADPSTHISFNPQAKLNNISVNDIPADVNEYEGDHSGDDYLAYSFFIKSVGTKTAEITAEIDITEVVKEADEAMRVMLYDDGIQGLYAKRAEDGNEEPGTIAFVDSTKVYSATYDLAPNEMKKYTIVIWLEGDDPECVNKIMGGFVQLKMNFSAK